MRFPNIRQWVIGGSIAAMVGMTVLYCQKVDAPPPAQRTLAGLAASAACQILPGQTVGLGFEDSQLCKADGTVSPLFYADTTPALFYPDADQHAFFDEKLMPFPVVSGKLYVGVLRASGAQWFTMPCFAQYHACRDAHAPPWPDNTCEIAKDFQVFDPNTLAWLGQATSVGGVLLPKPNFGDFVCPTPVPTHTVPTASPIPPSRTSTPKPQATASPTSSAPTSPTASCPPCASPTPTPSCPPCPCATKSPVPSPPTTASSTPTSAPCNPPFCVATPTPPPANRTVTFAPPIRVTP